MVLNVGSMLVKAKFDGGSIITGISNVITRLKSTELTSKSLNTEFGRMKGTLLGLATVAGLTTGGILAMLTSAIMQSPFLVAALEKLKIQFMLFGNTIAKHVAPIMEKFVNLIKWLREKFEALPSPMQSIIVKTIIYGGIIAGILGTIGTFIMLLGAVKSSLLVLFPAGVIAAITGFVAGIWSIIAGSIALQVALGLVLGVIGVLAMDRLGFLTWISAVGEGFRNWDSIIRDIILSLLSVTALIGGIPIDLSRGDLGFSTTKAWLSEAGGAMGRIGGSMMGTHEYGHGSSSTSSAMSWDSYKSGKTQVVESQTNTFNIDASMLTGDFSDPAVQNQLADVIQKSLAEQQQNVTY